MAVQGQSVHPVDLCPALITVQHLKDKISQNLKIQSYLTFFQFQEFSSDKKFFKMTFLKPGRKIIIINKGQIHYPITITLLLLIILIRLPLFPSRILPPGLQSFPVLITVSRITMNIMNQRTRPKKFGHDTMSLSLLTI